MEQFIDREAELAWLREGWAEDRPQFRILFGRRRVGKSALLDRFAHGTRAIVYQAVEGTTGDQLRDLTAAVLACADDPVLRAAPLANWGQALATFARLAGEGPLLVILDEYQYAAEADPTLASQLQRWWSRDVGVLPLYLVLCGSYIRFFVQNVLTGPAYGRNTGSLQLRPLGYRQAAAFFPGWSHEDHVRAFAVTGGMPHYILQLYPDRSLEWNIVHRVLGRGAVLYREAELLVREELREPRLYFSILRAIADGHTRAHEIAVHMGARSEITPYLRTLEALELVSYTEPLLGKQRRGLWAIADPYLRFWFRFVLPAQGRIEHGASAERLYKEAIAPALDQFVSRPAFEEICRAWVAAAADAGILPQIGQVGAWWRPVPRPLPSNPRNQVDGEIEVVAARGSRLTLAGEAKWSREPVGFGVLNHLREVAAHVPGADGDEETSQAQSDTRRIIGAHAEERGQRQEMRAHDDGEQGEEILRMVQTMHDDIGHHDGGDFQAEDTAVPFPHASPDDRARRGPRGRCVARHVPGHPQQHQRSGRQRQGDAADRRRVERSPAIRDALARAAPPGQPEKGHHEAARPQAQRLGAEAVGCRIRCRWHVSGPPAPSRHGPCTHGTPEGAHSLVASPASVCPRRSVVPLPARGLAGHAADAHALEGTGADAAHRSDRRPGRGGWGP